MKKLIIVCTLICLVIAVGAGISPVDNRPAPNGNAIVEPIGDRDIVDIFLETPLVMIGTVEKIEKYYDSGVDYITIRTQDVIKGEAEDVIHSFDVAHEVGLEEGQTYLMFMQRDYITVFPEPRHTSYREDSILRVEDGKLKENAVGSEWYLKQLPENVDEAVKYLKSIPIPENTDEPIRVKDVFTTDDIMNRNSDYVSRISVVDVKEDEPHSVTLVYTIKQNYKGDFSLTKKAMPSRVNWQKGKEYILFMNELKDGYIQLAAYDGAVICEDDELFEKAIEMLENNN